MACTVGGKPRLPSRRTSSYATVKSRRRFRCQQPPIKIFKYKVVLFEWRECRALTYAALSLPPRLKQHTMNGTISKSSSLSNVAARKPENIGVFTNPQHELYTKTSPIPTPGPGECLIHVRATGICGSDVHFWRHGKIGSMVVTGENCLGHESAGEVIAIGEGVTRFRPGEYFCPLQERCGD